MKKKKNISLIIQQENEENRYVQTPFDAFFIKRWTIDLILLFVFVLIWTIILLTLFIGKFVYADSINDVFDHFTSWNWSANSIFFLLVLFSFIDWTRYMRFILHLTILWLIFGICFLVFFLVFVLLANNPSILLSLTKEEGGPYNAGLVLNFNTVYHTLPAIAILVYVFLARVEITLAVGFCIGYFNSLGQKVFYFIWYLLSPLLFIGLYCIIFNLKTIYGLTINLGFLALIAIGVVLIMVGIPLGLFKYRFDYSLKLKRKLNNGNQSEKERKIRTIRI
jgi:hypothetical protein